MPDLSVDLIYEAVLDDELFAALPTMIADAFEARSCVLHFLDEIGTSAIAAHSGYFSDAQMLDYAENFADVDLWTKAGTAQDTANRAWRCSDLVSDQDYLNSRFFNDWIRGMGDDTFFCAGSVMQTRFGAGIIGLHRGRTQVDFERETLARLNGQLDHLRRLFALRSRFAQLQHRSNLLEGVLAASGQAAIVVSCSGEVRLTNGEADALLRAGTFIRQRRGILRAQDAAGAEELAAAIRLACSPERRQASTCLLRGSSGQMVIATVMPLLQSGEQASALVTIARQTRQDGDDRLRDHLRRGFQLSPAEADIAVLLAGGSSLAEVSERRRSSIATVRTQVKTVLAKLGGRRQGDVIRLVEALRQGRVPVS